MIEQTLWPGKKSTSNSSECSYYLPKYRCQGQGTFSERQRSSHACLWNCVSKTKKRNKKEKDQAIHVCPLSELREGEPLCTALHCNQGLRRTELSSLPLIPRNHAAINTASLLDLPEISFFSCRLSALWLFKNRV